jgi:hypothetical protein
MVKYVYPVARPTLADLAVLRRIKAAMRDSPEVERRDRAESDTLAPSTLLGSREPWTWLGASGPVNARRAETSLSERPGPQMPLRRLT